MPNTGIQTDIMNDRESFHVLSASPLAAAYFLPPLLAAFGGIHAATSVSQFMDYTWLVAALVGTMLALFVRGGGTSGKGTTAATTGGIVLLVAAMLLYHFGMPLLGDNARFWPAMQEARLPVYFLFALAWTLTIGTPTRTAFVKAGGILGLMVCADLVVYQIILSRGPVPLLPNGGITASLLLFSLCAGLDLKHSEMKLLRMLTMLGILATFSRPALFGALWATLFFGSGTWYRRLLFPLFCLLILALTIFVRHPLFSNTPHYVDYWMWLEGVRLMLADPSHLLTGFPLTEALPGKIPFGLMHVWEATTGYSAMDGAYIFQAGPMWLRLLLAWGIAAPAAFMLLLLVLVGAARNRFMAGLATCIAAQGLLVGLPYAPVTAVPLWLALFSALAAGPDSSDTPQPHSGT